MGLFPDRRGSQRGFDLSQRRPRSRAPTMACTMHPSDIVEGAVRSELIKKRRDAMKTTAETSGAAKRKPEMPLEETRAEIEARLAVLRRRVQKVQNDLARKSNPLGHDSEENAQIFENDEVLEGLETEGIEQIGVLEAALARIDAGTYGFCADCGKRIAVARLKALPHAARCFECAEKGEKR